MNLAKGMDETFAIPTQRGIARELRREVPQFSWFESAQGGALRLKIASPALPQLNQHLLNLHPVNLRLANLRPVSWHFGS